MHTHLPPIQSTDSLHEQDFVRRAQSLFEQCERGVRPYHEKCRQNEQYWRAQHWRDKAQPAGQPQPVTPVLFSTIENMLADFMDSYPEPVVLGQGPQDDQQAAAMDALVRHILKRRHYRSTYREKCRMALKYGTSVQEIYWDDSLYGGLGDVNIRTWDITQFVWDPMAPTLQQGRACFKVRHHPLEYFKQHYPDHAQRIAQTLNRHDKMEDEFTAQSSTIRLIEYWYKKDGAVHMAKIASDVLLCRSEQTRPQGMYAHGQYPFVMEALYPLHGQPIGLGLIDLYKNLQVYADKLDQIILKNAMMSSKVKLLISRGADLDEAALLDGEKEVVRGARVDDGAVRWFQSAPLSHYILTHQQQKLAAIREESGQNQFNRGEGGRGVTAASAILALQEAGSKRSRMLIEQLYDGFEQVVRLMLRLIAENYTEARRFRVTEQGVDQMLEVGANGSMMEFDLAVQVQQQTPYRTAYQNELALQLYTSGLISREDALEMMRFDGKQRIVAGLRQQAPANTAPWIVKEDTPYDGYTAT